jgi:ribosome maturation factor RimP
MVKENEQHGLGHGVERNALDAIVLPMVLAHGAELVSLELKTDRGGWVLRITVEKRGAAENNLSTEEAAIDLERCSAIARELSPELDIADPIPFRYSLEVGSPGVERELRTEADFLRFSGKRAKVKLARPVAGDGQRVLVGTLAGVDSGNVRLETGGRTHVLPLTDVVEAHLVFELSAAPRPGKKKPSSR